jgi:hypothetical protein
MSLEIELGAFGRMKEQLLTSHEGKFVLFHGEDFLGAFDSVENAYVEGVKLFGQDPFLVKKVTPQEEVYRNQALSLGLIHAGI